jgi:hypothetical protein
MIDTLRAGLADGRMPTSGTPARINAPIIPILAEGAAARRRAKRGHHAPARDIPRHRHQQLDRQPPAAYSTWWSTYYGHTSDSASDPDSSTPPVIRLNWPGAGRTLDGPRASAA